MEIRCPACKKLNSDNDLCQRCGTDLAVLTAIRSAAQYYLEQSRKHILRQGAEKALRYAQRAWDLEHTPQAAKQAFLSSLLLEHYDQATVWYALAAQQKRNEF